MQIEMLILHFGSLSLREHLPGCSPTITERSKFVKEQLSKAFRELLIPGNRIDAVCFTGTLVDVPSYLRDERFWKRHGSCSFNSKELQEAAKSDYQLIRDLLTTFIPDGIPIFICPGEQDDVGLFEEVFGVSLGENDDASRFPTYRTFGKDLLVAAFRDSVQTWTSHAAPSTQGRKESYTEPRRIDHENHLLRELCGRPVPKFDPSPPSKFVPPSPLQTHIQHWQLHPARNVPCSATQAESIADSRKDHVARWWHHPLASHRGHHTYFDREHILSLISQSPCSTTVLLSSDTFRQWNPDVLNHIAKSSTEDGTASRMSLHVDGGDNSRIIQLSAPSFSEYPHCVCLHEIVATEPSLVNTDVYAVSPKRSARPLVLLDRDGVVNVQPAYRTGPKPLELVPGAGSAIKRLHELGYVIAVISTQSCVGDGFVTEDLVQSVMDKVRSMRTLVV
eukprot:gb/GECG01007927.1/.p1 GENE.gb/GECG01007927.1/~~gb/GECG01007927.1/.p1  ORF type:complete len:449 (+),score=22.58 gb/GECG01007927.1/:1-1347(+)